MKSEERSKFCEITTSLNLTPIPLPKEREETDETGQILSEIYEIYELVSVEESKEWAKDDITEDLLCTKHNCWSKLEKPRLDAKCRE